MKKWILVLVIIILAAGGYYWYKNYYAPAQGTPVTSTGGNPEVFVNVEAREYSFTPSSITVSKGARVRITLTNGGTVYHSFTVDALSLDTGLVAPGSTASVDFTAPQTAGSYQFHCSVVGHADLGMVGTLTVK